MNIYVCMCADSSSNAPEAITHLSPSSLPKYLVDTHNIENLNWRVHDSDKFTLIVSIAPADSPW